MFDCYSRAPSPAPSGVGLGAFSCSRRNNVKGRPYTKRDMKGMQEALAIVTAYNMGTEPNEFGEYINLLRESDDKAKEHLSQLAWLLLKSIETHTGIEKEEILAWYGRKFASAELEG